MVDLTNIKDSFLFAVVFVAIFALLITLGSQSMPLAFSDPDSAPYYFSPPEYFNAADIEDLATFYNITADDGGSTYYEDWGIDEGFGHHFSYILGDSGGATGFNMKNQHYFVFYAIFEIKYGVHDMTWLSRDTGEDFGTTLTQSEFDTVSETSSENITSARFKVQCEHVYIHASVAFNATAYANATDAFNDDALTTIFAINWDELGTGLNAYALISQIMTFNRPDIHPALNSLIAIPLWAAIGFIVVVIILAIIEALPFT